MPDDEIVIPLGNYTVSFDGQQILFYPTDGSYGPVPLNPQIYVPNGVYEIGFNGSGLTLTKKT